MKVEESFLERFQLAQSQLKAPKNQRNNFGKYNYRSNEDVLESLKPVLSEHKLIIHQTDEIVQAGDRYYIKAESAVLDVLSDQKLTATAWAREPETKKGMDESQITGAASSYARKYSLNGLFGIDDNKDADSGQPPKTDTKPPKPKAKAAPKNQEPTQDEIYQKWASIYEDRSSKAKTIEQWTALGDWLKDNKGPENLILKWNDEFEKWKEFMKPINEGSN